MTMKTRAFEYSPPEGFVLRRSGGVWFLQSSLLNACEGVTHAFCTRWGGARAFADLNVSAAEGDDGLVVEKNWSMLAAAFRVPRDRFVTLHQVHGQEIMVVTDDPDTPEIAAGDGIITTRAGLAIGIKTADCVPVLLADRARRVIGAVHGGWRGTSLNIAGKAVRMLRETFSVKPSDLLVAIGPAIGPCCYEVDERVRDAMGNDGRDELLFRPVSGRGRWMMDLVEVNRRQLAASGVDPERIAVARVCTACRTDMFFSHRGEPGGTGRQLSFIMMAGS